MAQRWLAIAGLVLVMQTSVASAQLRLEGLERLYFERIAGPGGQIPSTINIAMLMPETLQHPGVASTPQTREGLSDEITVHDFELTSQSSNRQLWVREIVDQGHPRVAQLWWVLYDGGRRSDVWNFTAIPDRTDNKILTNYCLDSVSMPRRDTVVFRVRGEMFRPGGAWWIMGNEWTFAVSESAVVLTRVCNVFSLSRGYDKGKAPPSLSASTEREIGGRYEIRAVDSIPDKTLRECRFQDPMLDDNWKFSWDRLLEIAQCITNKPNAKVGVRDLNAASFIERKK